MMLTIIIMKEYTYKLTVICVADSIGVAPLLDMKDAQDNNLSNEPLDEGRGREMAAQYISLNHILCRINIILTSLGNSRMIERRQYMRHRGAEIPLLYISIVNNLT